MKKNDALRNSGYKFNTVTFIAVALVMLFVCIGFTYTWISQNGRLKTNGMKMSIMVEQEEFDLAAIGDDAGTYKDILEDLGVAETGTDITIDTYDGKSTKNHSAVYWNVNGESNMNNVTENGKIAPNSSGKLTFYVISHKDGELNITLKFGTVGYKTESSGVTIADNAVNALLGGHILFFKTCTNGIYSDYLDSNVYEFSMDNAVKDEVYECNVYWYWPLNVKKMIVDSDKVDQTSREEIIAEMIDDVDHITDDGYYSKFFKHANPSAMKAIVTTTTMSGVIDDSVIKTVSACYNQGDQRIAINADYLLLRLGVWEEDDGNE